MSLHPDRDQDSSINVVTLSGQALNLRLQGELLNLETIHDLKEHIADAYPTMPRAPMVKLLGVDPSADLPDFAPIPRDQTQPLTHVVVHHDLVEVVHKYQCSAFIPEDSWLHLDVSELFQNPRKMFQHEFDVRMQQLFGNLNFAGGLKEFMDAWKLIVMGLPTSSVNRIYDDSHTILSAMLGYFENLVIHFDKMDEMDDMMTIMMTNFVKRPDVHSIVNAYVRAELGCHNFDQLPTILLCMRDKKAKGRNQRRAGIGFPSVALAMMNAHAVASDTWNFRWKYTFLNFRNSSFSCSFDNNMLQYILGPVSLGHLDDKDRGEALLCKAIAAEMSLHQLCHCNPEGLCALSHAEAFSACVGPDFQGGVWDQARESIKASMISKIEQVNCCYTLAQISNKLQMAFKTANDEGYESSALNCVLAACEDALWKHAVGIRRLWLRSGWNFKSQEFSRQIEEVVAHHVGELAERR